MHPSYKGYCPQDASWIGMRTHPSYCASLCGSGRCLASSRNLWPIFLGTLLSVIRMRIPSLSYVGCRLRNVLRKGSFIHLASSTSKPAPMTEASLCDWLLAQGSIRHPTKTPISNSVGFEKTGRFLGKLRRRRGRQYQVNDAGRGWLPGCTRRDRREGGRESVGLLRLAVACCRRRHQFCVAVHPFNGHP